jgi:glycosyltransferase involved in cell wall biosynthesis
MNVLLVTHRFPPDGVGGVERYVESLAAELRTLGDRVRILTRTPAHWPRRPQLRRTDDVFRIVGSGVRLDEPGAHADTLARLQERVIAATSPTVVHVNQLIGLSPSIVRSAQMAGAAVVVTLHDYYFACPLVHLEQRTGAPCEGPAGGRECERACFPNQSTDGRWRARTTEFRSLLAAADRVTAPSESVASYFSRHTAGAVRPVVLANGTAIRATSSPCRAGGDVLRLAVVGSVSRHKGVHVVVEALRLAGLERVDLDVWGRIDDPAYVVQIRAAAARVPGLHLEIGGEYEPGRLPQLLRDVDVAIVASQVREASPIVPREALANGVPVVVARIGGLPELIEEGVNGRTFDPTNPQELARVVRALAEDPALLEELRRGACATPTRSLAEHAKEMREVFVSAVRSRLREGRCES